MCTPVSAYLPALRSLNCEAVAGRRPLSTRVMSGAAPGTWPTDNVMPPMPATGQVVGHMYGT